MAASYLTNPLTLLGLVMVLALLTTRHLLKSGVIRIFSSPIGKRTKHALNYGIVLGLLVSALGVYLQSNERRGVTGSPAGDAGRSEASNTIREVDFGFVELAPGYPVAVPSYKHGKAMVLYGGEDFEFRVLSDGPMLPLELRVGDDIQLLPGSAGKVKIVGPANQPLPAVLLARGSRVSLPGAAPPRISVKVQVFGVARPK